MKFKYLIIFFVFLGSLSFAEEKIATNLNLVQPIDKPVLTDCNKILVVAPSEKKAKIILKSNPTTGYTWALRGYDRGILSLKKQYFIAVPEIEKTGADCYECFEFEVNEPLNASQITEIKMIYLRSFEPYQPKNEMTLRVMIYAS